MRDLTYDVYKYSLEDISEWLYIIASQYGSNEDEIDNYIDLYNNNRIDDIDNEHVKHAFKQIKSSIAEFVGNDNISNYFLVDLSDDTNDYALFRRIDDADLSECIKRCERSIKVNKLIN